MRFQRIANIDFHLYYKLVWFEFIKSFKYVFRIIHKLLCFKVQTKMYATSVAFKVISPQFMKFCVLFLKIASTQTLKQVRSTLKVVILQVPILISINMLIASINFNDLAT